MNIEKERGAFEKWAVDKNLAYRDKNGLWFYEPDTGHHYWIGYQAGRAALQSQDREDAERYRHLRDKGGLDPHDIFNAWWLTDNGNPQTLDEAIDSRRRIEGEGE